MTQTPQESAATAGMAKPVAVVDRDAYHALLAEREFLATAVLRHRMVSIVRAFTLAVAAALMAFMGGFWVGQHIDGESFKMACSRVVDEAMKNAKVQGSRTLQIDDTPAAPVQKVSH